MYDKKIVLAILQQIHEATRRIITIAKIIKDIE